MACVLPGGKKWGSLPSAHLFSENEARVREGYGGTEQDNYADQRAQETWMGIERRVIPTL